jgi:enoyl-CoA hydratase
MEFQSLLLEIRDAVAVITINRPDKLNALHASSKVELRKALEALAEDDGVRAVIITGAGEKAFVAGTDIKELTDLDRSGGERFAREGQALFDIIARFPKPVIAAVNGFALGGGCELAMACHLRIASENAKFGQPEVNLGIMPGYGGTQRLARLVGLGRALELMLTGEPIDAKRAQEFGLVNAVVPAPELLPAAVAMAQKIAAKGGAALRYILEATRLTQELPLEEGERKEAELFGACCDTEDFREGTSAFLEKRKPVFKHR